MTTPKPEKREYRSLVGTSGLVTFRASVKETDLLISARSDLSRQALGHILTLRRFLEERIKAQPDFLSSLEPLEPGPEDGLAPEIIRRMLAAGLKAGTGPMAAVAGAMAGAVGSRLAGESPEVIVENGGDLYLAAQRELRVAIHAGPSPLSGKLALIIPALAQPLGLATSSASVGHSLSLGAADAAVVAAEDPALADALATALGNRVCRAKDIGPALEWLSAIKGVRSGVVIIGKGMGAWGELELVRL